jgi:hypothetical protein
MEVGVNFMLEPLALDGEDPGNYPPDPRTF